MTKFRIREGATLFVKVVFVVFAILYCCFVLEPEHNATRVMAFTDGGPEVSDLPVCIVRTSSYVQSKLPCLGVAILPAGLNLIKTVIYESKAGFVSLFSCHMFNVVSTINAP